MFLIEWGKVPGLFHNVQLKQKHFLAMSDRGNEEAAKQRFKWADQQDATGPAELHHVSKGRVSTADAECGSHSCSRLQKPAWCCGSGAT